MALLTNVYRRLLRTRIVRVAFFGGLGVIAQTIIFEALGVWLGVLRPSLATLLGAEVGVLINFALNNRYSFNDRTHAPLLTKLVRFHIVVSGALFIQWLCVFMAESYTENWWILHGAYVAGILLAFVSNYTWYRLWVWRHHGDIVE